MCNEMYAKSNHTYIYNHVHDEQLNSDSTVEKSCIQTLHLSSHVCRFRLHSQIRIRYNRLLAEITEKVSP